MENLEPRKRKQAILGLEVLAKAGKVSDMTEDVVRKTALRNGLVDVKVCSVSEVWSGLKLVVRKENRKC